MKVQDAPGKYDLDMDSSHVISIVALCISAIVGTFSTIFAFKANGRAARAEEKAEQQEVRTLWSDLISSAHEALTADVTSMDMRPILVNLRRSASELASGLPRDKWPYLDEWLQAEHLLGTALFEQALLLLGNRPSTPDDVLRAHRDSSTWCAAYLSNLRYMRQEGPTGEIKMKIPELTAHALALREEVHKTIASLLGQSPPPSDESGSHK